MDQASRGQHNMSKIVFKKSFLSLTILVSIALLGCGEIGQVATDNSASDSTNAGSDTDAGGDTGGGGSTGPSGETGSTGSSGGGGSIGTGGSARACTPAVAGVVCGYNIADLSATRVNQTTIQIPQAGIIAFKFSTTAGSSFAGKFLFQVPTGMANPATNFWISTTPGGSTLVAPSYNSYRCSFPSSSFIYNLTWAQWDSDRYCYLEPSTTYYFNLKHVDVLQPASYILRDISHNGKP